MVSFLAVVVSFDDLHDVVQAPAATRIRHMFHALDVIGKTRVPEINADLFASVMEISKFLGDGGQRFATFENMDLETTSSVASVPSTGRAKAGSRRIPAAGTVPNIDLGTLPGDDFYKVSCYVCRASTIA
jgi:hypothetical protein